ncbi:MULTISPECIES: hypothetical protein [unclassified Vibrio]|uniref:hypothetical protein n=1 Tax=unclassified Vibrio TaxID=2614977 RepID=UPI001482CB10|nr:MULTISPECIES: hypothetical protein [unclassified Vibrio]MDQ2192977.1 hypothetical protein [Vibrio sp. A14(2019)]MDQ2198506.1 hypothetical protein [Vibrio sp. 2017_1457_11]NNN77594.1 hypothetical protein [Vibrio sp. B7]NNN94389.1 hypothetical protein [Vibrio sp. B8-1]NNO09549.1 hypothetical protein [Vibrio sp. B4-12]
MKKKADKTINQRAALNSRRNQGLAQAENSDPEFGCQGIIGQFIGYYLRCEVFATKLQHFYQSDKGYKQTSLNTKDFKSALDHFGMYLDDDKVIKIFQGGNGKRGTKSARQLRNGYLHELSSSDKAEIETNGPWLVGEMKKLLRQRIKT